MQEAENIIRCLLRHVRRSGEPSRCGEAGAALDGEGAAQRMQAEHPPGELMVRKALSFRLTNGEVVRSRFWGPPGHVSTSPCLSFPIWEGPSRSIRKPRMSAKQRPLWRSPPKAPSPLGHQSRQLRQDSEPPLTQQALHNP